MMKKWIAGGVLALATMGMGSTAFAGEINGTGNPPGGEGLGTLHAHSICAFSGLEDGDGAGFPGPGGAPPQERKASGEQPGDSCNGHTGFLAGGGGKP